MDFRLSDSFIEPYKTAKPDWGPLGEFVYLRTYSRKVESEDRNEAWWETVRRVVEGVLASRKSIASLSIFLGKMTRLRNLPN